MQIGDGRPFCIDCSITAQVVQVQLDMGRGEQPKKKKQGKNSGPAEGKNSGPTERQAPIAAEPAVVAADAAAAKVKAEEEEAARRAAEAAAQDKAKQEAEAAERARAAEQASPPVSSEALNVSVEPAPADKGCCVLL